MNRESKTFEEVMSNINNLLDENYIDTIYDMINFSDDDQRNELYDAFIKEIKNRMINHENYMDEELLESDINDIMNSLIELDPEIEYNFINNGFNLEEIKVARLENRLATSNNQEIEINQEVTMEPEIEEEKEITKIENRINELETKYKKEILLSKLNEIKYDYEETIKTAKGNINTDRETRTIEIINTLENSLTNVENDIKNVEENYNELSSTNNLTLILLKNKIDERNSSKETLISRLNERKAHLEEVIENTKIELEEIKNTSVAEDISVFEKSVASIEGDIKNIEDNYSELVANDDLTFITSRNNIDEKKLIKETENIFDKGEFATREIFELTKEIEELDNKLKFEMQILDNINYEKTRRDILMPKTFFEGASNDDLKEELEQLKKRKEEIWPARYDEKWPTLEEVKEENKNPEADGILFETNEIFHKITIIETELRKRELESQKNELVNNLKKELTELKKLKSIKNAYYELINDTTSKFEEQYKEDSLEKTITNNHNNANELEDYENTEKLKRELLEEIKDKQNVEKESEEKIEKMLIERTEKNKKLWLKALAGTVGFATGLTMSCVPGVGTIRMGIAATKLAGSAINLWTKKHPNGKIAKVKNNLNDKLNDKFPGIMNKAAKMREKLKEIPLNCFFNGLAIGYTVGNIVESLTGENIIENIKDRFGSDSSDTVIIDTEVKVPTEESVVPDTEVEIPTEEPVVPDTEVEIPTEEPLTPPVIDEEIVETFIPKEGEVFDLSGLSSGLVSEDAPQAVSLIQDLGKEVTFDKAVQLPDGRIMWHFKQLNGAGYAWFDSADVQELLSKGADVVSKTM